jgi:3-methyladenine DNA glycosylase AlkD
VSHEVVLLPGLDGTAKRFDRFVALAPARCPSHPHAAAGEPDGGRLFGEDPGTSRLFESESGFSIGRHAATGRNDEVSACVTWLANANGGWPARPTWARDTVVPIPAAIVVGQYPTVRTMRPEPEERISPMTVSDVLVLLEAERDERGMRNWEKLGSSAAGMRSYGIGLTRLRKLAKRIGRNRDLARALWKTDVYEARVIALLVDDPARITREQAEQQVEELAGGMLAHVFASCDATLAKTPFVVELADQWVRSDDPVRRECGYALLYEASKFPGRKAPSEDFFLAHVERIADTIGTEPEKVRMSMGAALMGIGKRSAVLNEAALKIAREVGPIEFTSASGECEPFDVVRHLTTDRLKEKLGTSAADGAVRRG